MTDQLPTPTPRATLETEPFWAAAAEGRLTLPRCNTCHKTIWYPRLFCPSCGGEDIAWVDSPGTGSIYSFTVVERGQGRWKEHSPYVLAYVELDEGPRILTNIVGSDPDTVSIGARVSAHFDPGIEGGAVLRFTLG